MFKLIYAGATSACFELHNDAPYYAPEPYSVSLDGRVVCPERRENVFSLFSLAPDTEYRVALRMGEKEGSLTFRTRRETCALSARDFGAVGDGRTDDTAALQRAILLLPAGGRLVLDAGTYLTSPLFLKSHMTLELREGATLLGETDKAKYPVLPGLVTDAATGACREYGAFEGLARDMYAALITAQDAEDITLVGPGLVDGNAQNAEWWKTFKQDPVARPRLFFMNRCRGVTVHGLQAANSASWQFHPYNSQHLAFLDVAVSAPKNSPNTDALDPESCDGVEIIGCRFSVGDDCIAIKSGKQDPRQPHKAVARAHTIRNCLMQFGHGAVVLGSELTGGVKDLTVSQCLFRQTDRGLRIKTRRGRGRTCDIDGVEFDNIRMEGVLTPIVINMWYNCVDPDGNSDYVQSREKLPVDDRTPHLGAFAFRNMECDGAEVAACYVDGLPEMPVDSVTLTNVRIRFSENARPGKPSMQTYAKECCRLGLFFDNVGRVELTDVTLEGEEGEPLIARHTGQVLTKGFGGTRHV